ncbi:MAG: ferric reductase-like transmembrane domain-containing protein [Pseudomonadota bacterium]
MVGARAVLIWALFAVAILYPLWAAAQSPLLAWRDAVYIASGFAGIIGLALLLMQPLLAARFLPGLSAARARRLHRYTGIALVAAVIVHVAGLWLTSPPDVVDALLFASPTAFSAWGVVAMWAVFATALITLLRRRLKMRWLTWRIGHAALGVVIVLGTVVHALLIEGTMETLSKIGMCVVVTAVTGVAMVRLRVWSKRPVTR